MLSRVRKVMMRLRGGRRTKMSMYKCQQAGIGSRKALGAGRIRSRKALGVRRHRTAR